MSPAPDLPFAASGKSRRQTLSAASQEGPPAARAKALVWPRTGPHVTSFPLMLVGAERFELPTPCSQNRCATRLRYAPTPPPPYRKKIPLGKFLVYENSDVLAYKGWRTLRKARILQFKARNDQLEELDVVPEDMVAGSTHSRAWPPRRFRPICPHAIRMARPDSVR